MNEQTQVLKFGDHLEVFHSYIRYSHYFALLNVKIHSVQFTPRPEIIKVFLKQCVTSTIVNYPRSFVVVSIKGNGITRIDDIREITDENDKKE